MPKELTCDICGAPDANEDYDGAILCTYHRAVSDLRSAKDAYRERREWVKEVFLSDLARKRQEIARLEKVIAETAPEQKDKE